jgi:hypothetical protein
VRVAHAILEAMPNREARVVAELDHPRDNAFMDRQERPRCSSPWS